MLQPGSMPLVWCLLWAWTLPWLQCGSTNETIPGVAATPSANWTAVALNVDGHDEHLAFVCGGAYHVLQLEDLNGEAGFGWQSLDASVRRRVWGQVRIVLSLMAFKGRGAFRSQIQRGAA